MEFRCCQRKHRVPKAVGDQVLRVLDPQGATALLASHGERGKVVLESVDRIYVGKRPQCSAERRAGEPGAGLGEGVFGGIALLASVPAWLRGAR